MEKEKPIGVFDSGIGGLTVVKRISSILPTENIVYFGDTARVPYGSKSNATVVEYSLQDAAFLMSKNVKVIVVACNTASAVALEDLRKHFHVPVIGMIEPGAAFALKNSVNGKIGVIGTNTTINNHAYSKAIHHLNPDVEVFEKACPLFVPLAEEGWIDHKATYLIAEEYLKELKDAKIDTLVLGCTHYPILYKVIQDIMGEDVKLIDSGIAAASVVKSELERIGFCTNSYSNGLQDFYVSDIPQKFKEIAELFMGRELQHIKRIETESLTTLKPEVK
ncbi:MAG TPA: glutamate racemase [Ignavibacteriales bacterium]|nr:glutamate racemase [Ignavibacteriales bacterium]